MNTNVQQALDRAQVPGYYGHIEVDISDGEVVVVRETRTTKLQSRKGNSRNDNQYPAK